MPRVFPAFIKLLLSFSLLFCLACAQNNNKGDSNIELTSDNLKLVVTGNQNVPKFTFGPVDNFDNEQYKAQFYLAYQADMNQTKIGSTNVALASRKWEFSKLTTSGNTKTFDISSADADPSIKFVVHMNQSDYSFKFDTHINNVNFHSDAEYFALCYSMKEQSGGGKEEKAQVKKQQQKNNQERVRVADDVEMKIQNSAKDGQSNSVSVAAQVKSDSGNNMVCLYYDKFSGEMVHDPEFVYLNGSSTLRSSFLLMVVFIALFAMTIF